MKKQEGPAIMKRTKRRLRLLAGFALAAVPISPAFAQTVPERPDPAPPASIDQIPSQPGGILAPPSAPRITIPSPQLTAEGESVSTARQLTSERPSPRAPAQLYKGKRTAQASDPLSRPADGRTGAIDRVEGKDRCDPAAERKKTTVDCANVIETRADEFARPETTPLSPEQRIIIAQQLRERAATAGGAAKLLAIGSIDADDPDAQQVASIVLKPPPEPVKEKKPVEEPSAADAAAAAIVNAIVNQPPR